MADPEQALPLSEHADQLARKAMDAQKDSATLAVTIGSSQLWAARTLFASSVPLTSNCQVAPAPMSEICAGSTRSSFKNLILEGT